MSNLKPDYGPSYFVDREQLTPKEQELRGQLALNLFHFFRIDNLGVSGMDFSRPLDLVVSYKNAMATRLGSRVSQRQWQDFSESVDRVLNPSNSQEAALSGQTKFLEWLSYWINPIFHPEQNQTGKDIVQCGKRVGALLRLLQYKPNELAIHSKRIDSFNVDPVLLMREEVRLSYFNPHAVAQANGASLIVMAIFERTFPGIGSGKGSNHFQIEDLMRMTGLEKTQSERLGGWMINNFNILVSGSIAVDSEFF